MRALVILSLALPLAAVPAVATDTPKDEDKVICRSTRVLGSNMSQRVCKTKGQWALERRQSRDRLDFDRPTPTASERSQGVL